MSATRTTPAPSSALERLTAIAHVVEDGLAGAPGGTLVRVIADDIDVELGLRPLDPEQHPLLELAGFVAPPEWWAVGLIVPGRAWCLDEAGLGPEDVVSAHFVERGGAAVSLLRQGSVVTQPPEPMQGRIPDLLRTILGLP